MLIKDNEGDWGVCVAVWRGMKKGTPGVPGMTRFYLKTNELNQLLLYILTNDLKLIIKDHFDKF